MLAGRLRRGDCSPHNLFFFSSASTADATEKRPEVRLGDSCDPLRPYREGRRGPSEIRQPRAGASRVEDLKRQCASARR